jgi:hypothetical protein
MCSPDVGGFEDPSAMAADVNGRLQYDSPLLRTQIEGASVMLSRAVPARASLAGDRLAPTRLLLRETTPSSPRTRDP